MFSSIIQPSVVSLFSSTGSNPLGLFSMHTDDALPSDSLICILNDSTSSPRPPPPTTLISPSSLRGDDAEDDDSNLDYTLDQSVLHIQSPTLRTTYIRCPPLGWSAGTHASTASARSHDVGLKHPWLHFQVRNLGREWTFEFGVVDQSGREGVIRCSTFQVLFCFADILTRLWFSAVLI